MKGLPKKGFSNIEMSVKALKEIKTEMLSNIIRKDRSFSGHIKPSLRMFKNRSAIDQKNLQTFLKVFVDKKTKLIKVSNIIAAMKGLGMKRQVDLVEHFFQNYQSKTKGYLTQQQYIKLIEKEQNRDINRLSQEEHEDLFNFFDRYSNDGKITEDKIGEAAEQLGIYIEQQQRKQMVKYFARNRKALDKYDFIQMLQSPYTSRNKKLISPRK